MTLAVYLLCVIALVVLIAIPGKRLRFQSTPTDLVISWKGRKDAVQDPQDMLSARYPNGLIRPAVGDFGESCTEVDVLDWRVVRALELGVYNCYWHTVDGEYLPAGITPAEEAEQAQPRPLTAAERNQGQPCWCDYCRGRVGVHGEDAVALYESKIAAFRGWPTAQTWWDRKVAELDYEVQDPHPDDVERVRAKWGELVAQAAAERAATAPWGDDVAARLEDMNAHPPVEGLTHWTQTRNGEYFRFEARYDDGATYRATKNGAFSSVEAGPRTSRRLGYRADEAR